MLVLCRCNYRCLVWSYTYVQHHFTCVTTGLSKTFLCILCIWILYLLEYRNKSRTGKSKQARARHLEKRHTVSLPDKLRFTWWPTSILTTNITISDHSSPTSWLRTDNDSLQHDVDRDSVSSDHNLIDTTACFLKYVAT